jgi:hypothetical protein
MGWWNGIAAGWTIDYHVIPWVTPKWGLPLGVGNRVHERESGMTLICEYAGLLNRFRTTDRIKKAQKSHSLAEAEGSL